MGIHEDLVIDRSPKISFVYRTASCRYCGLSKRSHSTFRDPGELEESEDHAWGSTRAHTRAGPLQPCPLIRYLAPWLDWKLFLYPDSNGMSTFSVLSTQDRLGANPWLCVLQWGGGRCRSQQRSSLLIISAKWYWMSTAYHVEVVFSRRWLSSTRGTNGGGSEN